MKRMLIPAALAGLLMIIAGCGSDSLAPNDPLPPLSEDSSAQQAGLVAYAVATFGPVAVNYGSKAQNNPYTYTFPAGGDIGGSVELNYYTGGAGGTLAEPGNADFVEMSTMGDAGLTVTLPLGGQLNVTSVVMANITRGTPDSATVLGDSGGTLVAGDYTVDFSIGAVTVYGTGYPTGGPISCTNGYHTVAVQFDGTAVADISLDDTVKWHFDLDTLELTKAK